MNIQKRTSSNYWLGLWGILYLLLGTHVACTDSGSPNSSPDPGPGPTVKSTNVTYKVEFININAKHDGTLKELKKVEEKDGKAYYQVPVSTEVRIHAIPDKNVEGAKFIWEDGKLAKNATDYYNIWTDADGKTNYSVCLVPKPGTITIRALGFYEDEKGEKPLLINSNQQPCIIQCVEENERKVVINFSVAHSEGSGTLRLSNLKIENVSPGAVDVKIFCTPQEGRRKGHAMQIGGVSDTGVLHLKKDETFKSKTQYPLLFGGKFTVYAKDLKGNILGKAEYDPNKRS